MKTEIFTMELEIEEVNERIKVEITGNMIAFVENVLTNKESNIIKEHLGEVSEIIGDAIKRDFKKEMKKKPKKDEEYNEIKKEIYDRLSKEEKEEIDEFERKLEEFETDEERADYAFGKLIEQLTNLHAQMRR